MDGAHGGEQLEAYSLNKPRLRHRLKLCKTIAKEQKHECSTWNVERKQHGSGNG